MDLGAPYNKWTNNTKTCKRVPIINNKRQKPNFLKINNCFFKIIFSVTVYIQYCSVLVSDVEHSGQTIIYLQSGLSDVSSTQPALYIVTII